MQQNVMWVKQLKIPCILRETHRKGNGNQTKRGTRLLPDQWFVSALGANSIHFISKWNEIQIKIKTTHRIDHRWISNMTYPKCVHHFSLHSIICICIMWKSHRMIMTYFQAFYGSSNHFMKFTHISSSNWHLNADQSSKYDCCIP